MVLRTFPTHVVKACIASMQAEVCFGARLVANRPAVRCGALFVRTIAALSPGW